MPRLVEMRADPRFWDVAKSASRWGNLFCYLAGDDEEVMGNRILPA
jgi:hypothetical protein